jgi:anthranilate phosphoribosyltransferase
MTDAVLTDEQLHMRSVIQRIATGPDLSKDISMEEARLATRSILEGKIDPVQAGIFFIALRMKRETEDENKGVLDGIRDVTTTVIADVDEVVDIADPYDGYNRTLPPSPFLPAVLAVCGVHAVTHGVETVGPKYGVTHRKVLRAAGIDVDLSVEQAAARLSNDNIGWAYIDQKLFCPALHDLVDFRSLIIKRPSITTVEVLTGPIRGKHRTHLVTGYVHKPYPPIYAMLARHAGFDSALLVRGVEGGVIASLRQTGKFFFFHDKGEETSIDFDPSTLGISQDVRAVPLPDDLPKQQREGDEIAITVDTEATAKAAADAALAAMEGKQGPTYDALTYGAAMLLWHLRRYDNVTDAAKRVRKVLDSGEALKRIC